jgi:hypothetical protein
MLTALAVLTIAGFLAGDKQGMVLLAGLLGMITYLLVNGLGNLFNVDEDEAEEPSAVARPGGGAGRVAGKAALMLFLYLEVIDASFSFDGVIGAFAITADPVIIALGLGLIGAMFVRSLTVYLVREGTLDEFEFLDHGAHWAIGALAIILLVTITAPVNEVVTGLIGVLFIAAAFAGSVLRNRKAQTYESTPDVLSSTSV